MWLKNSEQNTISVAQTNWEWAKWRLNDDTVKQCIVKSRERRVIIAKARESHFRRKWNNFSAKLDLKIQLRNWKTRVVSREIEENSKNYSCFSFHDLLRKKVMKSEQKADNVKSERQAQKRQIETSRTNSFKWKPNWNFLHCRCCLAKTFFIN